MERYTDTISGEELYLRIDRDSDKYYYKDKKMSIYHRIDGPAIEGVNGYKEWWVNDKLHRLDGPAIEFTDGTKAWCVDDVFIIQVNKDGKIVARME
jgi:hypothetical protein